MTGSPSLPPAAEIPVAETMLFLARALPPPPVRILEVGAGSGTVAAKLGALGHRVTALDRSPEAVAEARARGVHAVQGDFIDYRDDPFDAVLFTRSLHHLHPLPAAIGQARSLAKPGGLLIGEEFAFERMDRTTAEWLAARALELEHAGLLAPDESEPGAPLERWMAHHQVVHSVHTGESLVAALGGRFEVRSVERVPYLYRRLCARLDGSAAGAEAARRVLADERAGIAAGALRAIGLRIVAAG